MHEQNNYYSVQEEKFNTKIQAIIHASETKTKINWSFFDNYFTNINWRNEPVESLQDLYKQRAEQLRKKYDYLILFFSGGSDSLNILQTFIINNIKLDEIVVGYPESGLSNYHFNDKDTSAKNNISEFKYSIHPYLSFISNKIPETKITLHDYFIDMQNYVKNEWIINSSDWIHPSTFAKFSLSRYNHIHDILKSKTVASIYGLEKPIVIFDDKKKKYCYVLSDTVINAAILPVNHNNMLIERFYISHEFPKIMIKQAHTVKNECQKNQILFEIIENIKNNKTKNSNTQYQKIVGKLVYPDLPNIDFQTEKASTRFMVESDDWFYKLHKDSALCKMITENFNSFIESISSEYLIKRNNKIVGFIPFYKKFIIN